MDVGSVKNRVGIERNGGVYGQGWLGNKMSKEEVDLEGIGMQQDPNPVLIFSSLSLTLFSSAPVKWLAQI